MSVATSPVDTRSIADHSQIAAASSPWRSEPLHEQGATSRVVAVQCRTTLTGGEPQRGCFVVVDPAVPSRHEHLQDRRRTVGENSVGDERLGAFVVGATDLDRPVALQAADDAGQFVDPTGVSLGVRPIAHHLGEVDHPRRRYSWFGHREQRFQSV